MLILRMVGRRIGGRMWSIHELTDSVVDFCLQRLNGRVVINGGCQIPYPAHSRLFQLRSGEGPSYKERVQ